VTTAEEMLLDAATPPEAVVLSPAVKDADALGMGEFVKRRFPQTALILVREKAEPALLHQAMRSGLRDVVDLSRGTEELRQALDEALSWARSLRGASAEWSRPEPRMRAPIVAVFSSKGGTGKSFLASNLAAAMAGGRRNDTALLDLDTEMGDVFSYFGEEPRQAFSDLLALADERSPRQRIREAGLSFMPHLWGYAAPNDPAAPAVSGESVGKLLRAMRGSFDAVVVDCPAAYSDQVLTTFELADTILLITGLDVVGLKHLSIAARTLMDLGVPKERFRVVLNRADSQVGLNPATVERALGIPVDAMVPSSRLVPTCLNRGRPVVVEEPRSEVARAVGDLAGRIGPATRCAADAPQTWNAPKRSDAPHGLARLLGRR
jgi:pilus assembly protein CpaE